MKRVVIIGPPGAGKSTFARGLRDKTKLPLIYLDNIYHLPDKTSLSQEEFNSRIEEIVKEDTWILDGVYLKNIRDKVDNLDTIFYLDIDLDLCLDAVKNRIGQKREDFPYIEEAGDEVFYEYIRNYNLNFKDKILDFLNEFKYKEIHVFKSRDEAQKYLNTLTNM